MATVEANIELLLVSLQQKADAVRCGTASSRDTMARLARNIMACCVGQLAHLEMVMSWSVCILVDVYLAALDSCCCRHHTGKYYLANLISFCILEL
jgi:hypothetical protein